MLGRMPRTCKIKDLAKFTGSRRVFQRDGNLFKPGEIFRQPDLARTLQRISEKPDDFYHGALRGSWPRPCRRAAH